MAELSESSAAEPLVTVSGGIDDGVCVIFAAAEVERFMKAAEHGGEVAWFISHAAAIDFASALHSALQRVAG